MTTREERIAELKQKADQIAQTAKIRPIDSESFLDYREGFQDGERIVAEKSISIIEELKHELWCAEVNKNDMETCLAQNRELAEENKKLKAKISNNLPKALGLVQACVRVREMKEFNKEGLVRSLEEVKELLTKVLEEMDAN